MNEYQYIVCDLTKATLNFAQTNQTIINEGRVVNCKSTAAPSVVSEISGTTICTHFFCVFVVIEQSEITAVNENCTVIESLNVDNFHEKYLI